ncbi:ABC transporter ATP-binding protein [Auritidibacter ignavus]|uniref:ABC transporter ATP-binding protein n=1 Tax=Auritidibacter ignavus TaxID=678932 RepID=A0AAJ6DC19_9MICC|nr:ABC transporter ATP-binding protein [Auritidibacter ignavus]WGH92686.1 ABC transporter ATP-binding protein [Auritidibacter ignavus]
MTANHATKTASDPTLPDTHTTNGPVMSVHGVTKGFVHRKKGYQPVLGETSFTVHEGEFVTIIGPSGSGKSTLLKLLAGLEAPDEGTISLTGEQITKPSRRLGVVFQQHVLLPWLTAKQNVLFALEAKGTAQSTAEQREELADRWLELVHLSEAKDLKPAELSGGMQQRVGIARAFALEPEALLLDEPLGALDALTRHSLQLQVLHLSEQEKRTFVLVTHDVDEALRLSDRILVLSKGPKATIIEDVNVPFERPRDWEAVESSPEYLQLRRDLLTSLTTSEA